MFKLFVVAALLAATVPVSAQTVINQSPRASVMTVLAQRVQTDLAGDFYQSRDCRDAAQKYQRTQDAVIVYETMNVAAASAKKQDCAVTFQPDQVIAQAWQSFSICRRSDWRQALHASQTFGMSGMHPYQRWIEEFNQRNRSQLQVRVYQGSSATVQALLAREIDWGFIATAATAGAQSQGAIVCEFSTDPRSPDFLGHSYQHSLADLRIQFVILHNGSAAEAARLRLRERGFSDYVRNLGYGWSSTHMTADGFDRWQKDYIRLQSAY